MYGKSKLSGKLLNLIAAVEIFYQCFGKCIIQWITKWKISVQKYFWPLSKVSVYQLKNIQYWQIQNKCIVNITV